MKFKDIDPESRAETMKMCNWGNLQAFTPGFKLNNGHK